MDITSHEIISNNLTNAIKVKLLIKIISNFIAVFIRNSKSRNRRNGIFLSTTLTRKVVAISDSLGSALMTTRFSLPCQPISRKHYPTYFFQ